MTKNNPKSLRQRVLTLLKVHPATTLYLAEQLEASQKAVEGHLYRLTKEGVTTKLSWGFYALTATTE